MHIEFAPAVLNLGNLLDTHRKNMSHETCQRLSDECKSECERLLPGFLHDLPESSVLADLHKVLDGSSQAIYDFLPKHPDPELGNAAAMIGNFAKTVSWLRKGNIEKARAILQKCGVVLSPVSGTPPVPRQE